MENHYFIGGSCNTADLSYFYRKKDIETMHIFFLKKNKIQDYDH
jgi:hypothetical protein